MIRIFLYSLLSFLLIFENTKAEDDKEVYKHLNLFGEAFEKIKNNYVEPVNSKDLFFSSSQLLVEGYKTCFHFFLTTLD